MAADGACANPSSPVQLRARWRCYRLHVPVWCAQPEVGNTEEEGSSAGGLDAARAALLSRRVIRLPYSAALRHTVEEAQAAALRVLPTGAPHRSRHCWLHSRLSD